MQGRGANLADWVVSWVGRAPMGGLGSPPGPPTPSSEWPREPQVPLYLPKFHSGWEPPLDVLQEAPWEVEGLATAPEEEVGAPPAGPLPPPPALTSSAHLCPPPAPPLPTWPSPHTKRRWPFFPTADSSEPTILSKLPKTQRHVRARAPGGQRRISQRPACSQVSSPSDRRAAQP